MTQAPVPKTAGAQETSMTDTDIRATLDQHWAASDANDFELEHQIYREDAVLEYPQSGERIRGRRNIQITRTLQPSRKRFKVRRVIGAGDLWVTGETVGRQEHPLRAHRKRPCHRRRTTDNSEKLPPSHDCSWPLEKASYRLKRVL
jgi:hypothetical protein